MSLTYLLQKYDAIGVYSPKMSITVDQSFTGSAELAAIFQSALGQEAVTITCTSWDRSPGGDHLTLTGTASLLNIDNAEVVFSASDRDGDLFVTLVVTIPSGWSFLQSFPSLPGYYDPNEDEQNRFQPSFLNELSLGASKLVLTNQAHHSEALNVDLVPGLNFAGELYFMGALLGVKTLTGTEGPVFLSGPMREYRKSPDPLEFLGIRLRSPIPFAGGDWPIPIKSPSVYIKSPVDEDQIDHTVGITKDPGIYFFAEAEITGRTAELIAKYSHKDGSLVLCLYGRMTDFDIAGFSSLAQTTGGDDIQSSLPAEVQTPEGLQLTELGLMVDFTSLSILSVMVGVGCKTHWDLVPDKVRIDEIGMNVRVLSPFDSKSRSLAITLSGAIALGDVKLVVYAEYPTYRFGGGLPVDATVPLGHLIETYFPGAPDLPDMTITRLLFDADPTEKTFAMACTITDVLAIPVGATSFNIEAIAFTVNYNKSAGVTGAFIAEMTIAEATAVITGELTDTLTLTGSLQKFDLKKFWFLVTDGETLPEELPDIVFDVLTVSVSPGTGNFSLLGSTTIAWDGLSAGNALSTQIQFAFSRSATGSAGSKISAVSARLSLQGTGPAEIAPDFDMTAFNFLFEYQTGTGWKLSGGMNADLFGTALTLQAGYETSQLGKKIKLQAIASPAAKLIDLEGVGSYSFSQFDLLLDRRAVEGGKAQTFFDLRLASTLKLDHVFEVGGYLSISKTAETGSALVFKPDKDCASIDIDFPTGEGFGMTVELFEIGFVKETGTAGWSFTGTTYLGFKGLSSGWAKALPSRVFAKLVAGKNNARISALNVTDPIEIPLPKVDGQSLGKAVIQLTELGISIKPNLGMMLEAGLGLPAELNTFLGGRQVFRVYQKGNLLSMARTRFTISGTGVAMQFISSPFAGANAVVIQGESWFDIDFGQYGAISVKMPTFVYDGVTQYFEAGGGCKITRPLALPLKPLKSLLTACDLKAFADIFPDKIPLESVALVDKRDNFKTDEFVDFLKQAGDIPKEVVQVLKETGKLLNRFPDGFKHYFRIEVPEELEFKFGFSPFGRINVGLLASKQPIRVLFPSVVQGLMPLPGLTGIELRKLAVGTLMSGALFVAEVDAVVDQFDLPSLVVSLMLPADEDFPLPTSDQLQRRIILEDVFCIIPVSAGLPIPIPIFYDRIGLEYLGIEGLGMQAHMSFPKPELGGSGAMELFTTLKEFTTDNKALLDPKTPPAGLELAFTFRDEYLQAPEYLGGKLLGTKGKDVRVAMWKYVAQMMNFFKTFSINHFVGAIPFEHRVGSAEHKFAFMTFDADWLLTTPAEFKDGAFEKLNLSASDRDDFMDVLPAVATTGGKQAKAREEGLVLFLRGQADLAFIRLEAVFGLAASGTMGFNTGFKLDGTIAKIIDLELSGAVMVNAPLAEVGPTVTPVETTPPVEIGVGAGKALSLNGKDGWVEIPSSASLMLPEYTIELWIRPGEKQAGEWVEVFGVDSSQGGLQRNYYLAINAKKAFYHHRFKDQKSGNSGAPNTPDGSVKWGQWQHIALTNDGVIARTFIDGKQAAAGPVQGPLALLKQPIFIGKHPSGRDKLFKGDIAEVRIWKRARTEGEIEAQMREVLEGDEKDLVSLVRFSEETGSKAVDVCGRNHGTITKGGLIDSGPLMLDGLPFNGSSDYIEVNNSQSLELGAYTVEAWFKPRRDGKRTWACVAGKKGRNYSMYIHKNGFVHHRFHTSKGPNDGAPNTANNVVQWDRWNHVAITNDGKTARTYVNGVKQAEGPVAGQLFADKGKLQIGRTADAKNNAFFLGEIAEIRIWSQSRSLDDIKARMFERLTGKEANLVSLYRLGEAKGDTLADACGRNAGRMYMAERTEPEKLQHDGLIFSGQGDYAFIGKSDKWKAGQYTLEAWIRPDKEPFSSWQCIWGGNGKAVKLYIHQNGIVSHRFSSRTVNIDKKTRRKTTKDVANVLNTDPGQIRWGEWNHLAIINDGKTCATFVNGTRKHQGKVNGEVISEAAEIQIGRSDEGKDSAYFRGSIDDIRFFSVARTQAQIAADMHLPITGKETGIVAYYNMDHSAGTQLVDLGANKLHGTVNGADWALAVAPSEPQRAALQVQGHTHLTVAGHKAMTGDLRIVNSEVWFCGTLDLFPNDWPISVYGRVEGMVSKKRFYLSGETENKLFGLVLSKSRIYISNDEIRLEGRWLGAYTLLDISWKKGDPIFAGSVGFDASPTLDFGAIRIAGVKIADNVRISLDIHAGVAVVISKHGFSADVHASFAINGVGFSLGFKIDIAPTSLKDILNWIKQQIIDEPEKFLDHLFSDAAEWLENVGKGAIEFAKDAGEAIGSALKQGFGVTKDALADVLKEAGFPASVAGDALSTAYKASAQEVTKLLNGAEYAAEEVGKFLKDFGKHADAEVGKLLKGAGYAAKQTGKALQSVFKANPENAAKMLKVVGYAAPDVGDALQHVFGKKPEDCVKILKAAGFDPKDVGKAFESAGKTIAKEGEKVGKDIVKAGKNVGKAFKKIHIHF